MRLFALLFYHTLGLGWSNSWSECRLKRLKGERERERDIFAGKFEMSVVYKDLLIRERYRSFDLRIKTVLEVGKYIIYN